MEGNYFKELAMSTLLKTTEEIKNSYGKLYDLAKDYENREAVFLKELIDVLLPIDAATSVYVKDGEIHPNYVLEKLNSAKSLIETNIQFWESRRERK